MSLTAITIPHRNCILSEERADPILPCNLLSRKEPRAMEPEIHSVLADQFPGRKSRPPEAGLRQKLPLVLLFLCLIPACRATRWKQNLVYARAPVAIYLEREERKGEVIPQGFQHPASIPSDGLRGLLGGLRYRSWGLFRG